ncbi:MAG: hypothetical protein AAF215_33070 [Cyanobacteria bacterium P01_A01_bin.123]
MSDTSRYWTLMRLEASGKARTRVLETAKIWFESCFDSVQADQVQTQLWTIYQGKHDEVASAQLCLRCWVSQGIYQACAQLVQKFGQRYQFTLTDLLGYVLDDDGKSLGAYQPLTVKILESFDATKGKLLSWVYKLTQSHPDINRLLLDRGLYRASDWAILNDTSLSQLQRILRDIYGWSETEVAQPCRLLACYHQIYRQTRLQQRLAKTARHRCEAPNDNQLQQIDGTRSPQTVLAQLKALADVLRDHKVQVRQGAPFAVSMDSLDPERLVVNDASDDSETETTRFLQGYRSQLKQCLVDSLTAGIQFKVDKFKRKQPEKAHAFVKGLSLFHCEGLSMGAIAPQVGCQTQVQVTRLLDLKRFRQDVRNQIIPCLQTRLQTQALTYVSADRLQAIAHQLDQLLSDDVDRVMAEAAAEAQMPKNRTTRSLFAVQLCQTIHVFLDEAA